MPAISVKINWLAMVLVALFLSSFSISTLAPSPAMAATPNPAWQEDDDDDSEEQDSDDEDDDQDERKLEGQEDLDAAFLKKVDATTTRDLDKVAKLCQQAIEKGLKPDSEKQAKQLWSAVLMDYARQLDAKISEGGANDRNRRWRFYRREALKRLNKVNEITPAKTDALIMSAKLNAMPGGDRVAARESIEKAIEQIKDDKSKLSQAIYVRATLGEDEDAILNDLSQAIKIDEGNINAVRERGGLFMRQAAKEKDEDEADKKYKQATEDFKVWLKSDNDNVPQYIGVAESLRRIGRFDEATEIAEMAAKYNEDSGPVFMTLAQIHVDNDKTPKAIKALDRAIEIDKRNVDALFFRASIYFDEEEYDKAIEDATEVDSLQPDQPRGRFLISSAHIAREKYDDAIDELEDLIEDFPDFDGLKLQLAGVYNQIEKPSKSIEIYDDLIGSSSGTAPPRILRGRADAFLSIGKHSRAIADYERALRGLPKPDDETLTEAGKIEVAGVLNNLSWVLSTSPDDDVRDGKRALKMAEQAAELTDHKRAFILSTLASGFAETGDFEKARKWAKKAVELAESDEQREGLQDELDFYKEDKPWREKENVEGKDKSEDSDDDDEDEDEDEKKKKSSDDDEDDDDKDSDNDSV